jgi:ammonia channel protein AmtB
MLYRKNITRPESLLRIAAGLALAAAGLGWLGLTPLGMVLAATGATGIVTGLFGYCPACAMVGRKPVK